MCKCANVKLKSFIYARKSRNLSRVYVKIRNGRRSIFILSQRKENTVELLSIYERSIQIPMLNLYYSLYANTNVSLTGSRIICNINARVPRILYKYVVGVWKILESIRKGNVNSYIYSYTVC